MSKLRNLSIAQSSGYELIDFGEGRKLERFGELVVDRPSVPAIGFKRQAQAELWQTASIRFDSENPQTRKWLIPAAVVPQLKGWQVNIEFACLSLACSPVGHLGIFPEQLSNWNWIRDQRERLTGQSVLNLFAYTGGCTFAAASVGANVVHVDAAKNVVQRARRNAAISGLATAPIRWIVDDVRKFVTREAKRNRCYQAIFLDPPTYGHGANNESWQIDRDLPSLLTMLKMVLDQRQGVILMTSHSPGYDTTKMQTLCREIAPCSIKSTMITEPMYLQSRYQQKLPSGICTRLTWPA